MYRTILLAFVFLLVIALPFPASGLESSHRLLLNGPWTFSIHGHGQREIFVPSTYLPVGAAALERSFSVDASDTNSAAILHFDGVACSSVIWLNGRKLGEFGPYSPFQLEVTGSLKAGTNILRVELNDLDGFPPWTRNWIPAFPKFGGIIRDVYIEWKPAIYIKNAKLDYELTGNYSRADCRLHVWIANTTKKPAAIAATVKLNGTGSSGEATSRIQVPEGDSEQAISLSVQDVHLWSPESPYLYALEIDLGDGVAADHFQVETGFREFKTQGRDFWLNGKQVFLKGVFRHDMYADEGQTLTAAQMESDIKDIKSLGANFLRLGHYAHNQTVVSLAAKYGLLVSEEPPIFAMNQKDPEVINAAKFSLKGLIERDWNNPAVMVWFLSNEVGTDLNYMKEMSAFVHSLDHTRLVSLVDNTKWTPENAPWQNYRDAKLDFIAQNAYGSGLDGSYEKLATILPVDMPYMISEWGGTSDSYANVLREGQYYLAHSSATLTEGPRIAGISFWEYADIPIARWNPESTLHWSLTDQHRRPYETYFALKTLYTGQPASPPRGRLLVAPVRENLPRSVSPLDKYEGYAPIDLAGIVNSGRVLEQIKPATGLAYPADLPLGHVVVNGLPFDLENKILLLSRENPTVSIPIHRSVSEIDFLGHVCFNALNKPTQPEPPELPFLSEAGPAEFPPLFKAYPYAGEFGEQIGRYVLTYEDGQTETLTLSNGVHFADYRRFMSLSIIDPVATDTEEAVIYKSDYGTKTYQLRLFTYHPKRTDVPVRSVDFALDNVDYVPMLAAITVKVTKHP